MFKVRGSLVSWILTHRLVAHHVKLRAWLVLALEQGTIYYSHAHCPKKYSKEPLSTAEIDSVEFNAVVTPPINLLCSETMLDFCLCLSFYPWQPVFFRPGSLLFGGSFLYCLFFNSIAIITGVLVKIFGGSRIIPFLLGSRGAANRSACSRHSLTSCYVVGRSAIEIIFVIDII